MLRFGLISRVSGRRKANSQGMNRFFKNAHSRDQMSIKNSVNLELDALVQKPDMRRHLQPPGSRRTDDAESLYKLRLKADMSPQLITEVKSRMAENPYNDQFNMTSWEFQKRPWKVYGPKKVPYNKTHIISVHFTWNNIRFYMMDCNWEKFYENKAENDFYDEEWKENFFGSNTFFTKLGPYGNCHIFSSMRAQGFKGATARVDANVEYVAGKFGSEIINRGYDPHCRVILDFWGKNKQLRATAIKGLLASGLKIVSFTEGTVDVEHVKPKLAQRFTTVSPANVGMWDRFYKQKDREENMTDADEPE